MSTDDVANTTMVTVSKQEVEIYILHFIGQQSDTCSELFHNDSHYIVVKVL